MPEPSSGRHDIGGPTMGTEHELVGSGHEVAPVEAWDAIAADYDELVAPGETEVAAAALHLAGLRAGQRFLDVAAGSGGLSLPAARLGAEVLATDWSPAMIERFRSRAEAEGLSGAEGRVMDAHALDLADDRFDVTGSQFGVMLVPDQPRALREMVRVTRPGGRVVVTAYGPPDRFEALQLFIGALSEVVPGFEGLPDDPAPLEFQVSDPDVLARRLVDAGLRDVAVDTSQEERLMLHSGTELWGWMLASNPIAGMIVSDLDAEQQARVRGLLDELIRGRRAGSDGAVLTAALNMGVGTV